MQNVYTVKQVNAYIRNMFAQDFMLNRIYVKGEVSNVKYHTSGHIYFSLKDESGTIACVMFAGQRSGLSFRMREGQQIIVLGSISVYERDGKYQLYAKEIRLDGAGLLYERFLALKQELEEMGEDIAGKLDQIIPMMILTNSRKTYGACCIMYPKVLERLAGSVGGDYYLIPSSVHEFILLPLSQGRSAEELKEMIAEVNSSEIPPEDVLSDSLYLYSCKERCVKIL